MEEEDNYFQLQEECEPDFDKFIENLAEPSDIEMYLIESDFDGFLYDQLYESVHKLTLLTEPQDLILSPLAGDLLQCLLQAAAGARDYTLTRKDMASLDDYFDKLDQEEPSEN